MTTINVSFNEQNKEANIKISGRFDFSQHQTFHGVYQQLPANLQKVVIDFCATDYIDSSALGMLLLLRDKVNLERDRIHLANASSDVRKILEIANFNKLFTIV